MQRNEKNRYIFLIFSFYSICCYKTSLPVISILRYKQTKKEKLAMSCFMNVRELILYCIMFACNVYACWITVVVVQRFFLFCFSVNFRWSWQCFDSKKMFAFELLVQSCSSPLLQYKRTIYATFDTDVVLYCMGVSMSAYTQCYNRNSV